MPHTTERQTAPRTVLDSLRDRRDRVEDALEAEHERFDSLRRAHELDTARMRLELDDLRDAIAKLEAA